MAEIFGFEIKRKPTGASSQQFTAPTADDGVQTIMGGGHFGTYLDIEGKVNDLRKNELLLPEDIKKEKELEITTLQNDLRIFQSKKFGVGGDLFK